MLRNKTLLGACPRKLCETKAFGGWILISLEFNDIPNVEVYRIERG